MDMRKNILFIMPRKKLKNTRNKSDKEGIEYIWRKRQNLIKGHETRFEQMGRCIMFFFFLFLKSFFSFLN